MHGGMAAPGDEAGKATASVPFRGLAISVSRHPLPSRAAHQLSSSPDAFGDYALPGLDTMDIEEEEEADLQAQARVCSRCAACASPHAGGGGVVRADHRAYSSCKLRLSACRSNAPGMRWSGHRLSSRALRCALRVVPLRFLPPSPTFR